MAKSAAPGGTQDGSMATLAGACGLTFSEGIPVGRIMKTWSPGATS